MKTKIFLNSAVALGLALGLGACDENAFNDKLDGFKDKVDQPITNVQTIDYTLTAADYKAIADNSTNKALAGDANKAALAAVGTTRAFSDAIPAAEYVPAFLKSTSFPYFTLTQGAAVRLTYNVNAGLPAEAAEAAAATVYTISEDEYMNDVWKSDDDFIDAFAPSKKPSKFIPGILAANLDPGENGYAIVRYNMATQEPVFGTTGTPDVPAWEPSSVIGSVASGDAIEAKAVVTGICQQGYMVTDKSGSILVYIGRNFDPTTVAIGQQLNISGTVGAYNTGLQIGATGLETEVVGTQAVSYPAPKAFTQAELDAVAPRTDNALGIYGEIKAKVKVSGNNVNLIVDESASVMGSVYQGTAEQKAALTDGAEATVRGYMISVSAKRYVNFVVTHINGVAIPAAPAKVKGRRAPAGEVPTNVENVLYKFDSGKWAEATDACVLNPADYRAMGVSYDNLTVAQAKQFLPAYLGQKFPYAADGTSKYVLYQFYNSSSSSTYYLCDCYTRANGQWEMNTGIETVTAQFVNTGKGWIYDPTVYITLPSGRNQALSTQYYQACVDWVYNNICVPLGDTSIKSGLFYVSKYGNNEYYSGTSAYQGNVDLRAASAREQYPAGWEGMTDEQIVKTMKQRFMNEVMPGALAALHPDAAPRTDGVDLIYSITFAVYTGETTTYVARFKVVAPGKFEPVDCTWDN